MLSKKHQQMLEAEEKRKKGLVNEEDESDDN